jgi:hypothetical protein
MSITPQENVVKAARIVAEAARSPKSYALRASIQQLRATLRALDAGSAPIRLDSVGVLRCRPSLGRKRPQPQR